MQRLLVSLVFVLLAAGCATPAAKLDNSLVAQIQDGTSTRQDIERLFGRPKGEFTGSNGKQVVGYRFYRMYEKDDLSGTPSLKVKREYHLRMLSVLYGVDGRVERHHLYESVTTGSATRTGAQAGAVARPEQLALIHRGSTERDELVQYFGNPLGEELTVDGNLILSWMYLEREMASAIQLQRQMLQVVVSPSGTVRDFRVLRDTPVDYAR